MNVFKTPSLPSSTSAGSLKRKYQAPDAQEVYKASKLSTTSSPTSRPTNPSVEDEDGASDTEAGPALPPDEDEDDDEDGRFFGGGVDKSTSAALDYLDTQDEAAEEYVEEKIDSAWLRRQGIVFERKVNKNAELRAKYASEPQKFMASEADLDGDVKTWSLLSEHPELYEEFAQSDSVAVLVGLLAHENTDIAIGTIEIIAELLGEDVQAAQEQWDALVTSVFDADLLSLLLSNLSRLDEVDEGDRGGVYHCLAVVEALASQPSSAEKVGTNQLLEFLCQRISVQEKQVTQNKQYAAEVLQVLLQSSPTARRILIIELDGVDLFLRLLNPYRRREPEKDSMEEEFAENVFDALTCAVEIEEGKSSFLDAEGVELCLLMLQEKGAKFGKIRALRLLDHAMAAPVTTPTSPTPPILASTGIATRIVTAAGLKPLSTSLTHSGKMPASSIEHTLGIFSALLRLLSGESAERIRVLAKLTEQSAKNQSYDKVDRLLVLREDYSRRLAKLDELIAEEEGDEMDEDEVLSRRLEGGLFGLRTVDVVLAWLGAEDAGVRKYVDEKIWKSLLSGLQQQMEMLDDVDEKEMLGILVEVLSEK